MVRLSLKLKAKGGRIGKDPYVGDVWAGKTRDAVLSYNVSPCITRNRAGMGGYFLFSHMRMMRTKEMFRLQGVPPGRLKLPPKTGAGRFVVSDRQMALMIGNAFDVNLFARLFSRIFYSVGFTNKIIDEWGTDGDIATVSDEED